MYCFFFFKQKTAYEMRISDWSSDVCSSDLVASIPALYSDAGVLHVAARAAQDSQVYWLRTRSMGVWSAAVLLVPPPTNGGGSFTAAPLRADTPAAPTLAARLP